MPWQRLSAKSKEKTYDRKTGNLLSAGCDYAAEPDCNGNPYAVKRMKTHRICGAFFFKNGPKNEEKRRFYNNYQRFTLILNEKCGKMYHGFGIFMRPSHILFE